MSRSEPEHAAENVPPPGGVPCDLVRSRLVPYRDGELNPRDFGQVRAHLLDCAACRGELSAHEALSELVRGWRVATSDLWKRVAPQLDAGPPRDAANRSAEEQPGRAERSVLDAALAEAYGVPPPSDPPRPPTAVGAPGPDPDEDGPAVPRLSFWGRFGQRVADAFTGSANPTPQQMMEARDLLRRAADEIDAMLASVGHGETPNANDELAAIRGELAGLREEVAVLRSAVERRP